MNSQLYAHLEAFDSYDDDNENSSDFSRALNAASDQEDTKNAANIESHNDANDHREIGSLIDGSTRYIPVIAALLISSSCNNDSITVLSIFIMSFGWLVCWQQEQKHHPRSKISRVSHQESSVQIKPSVRQEVENEVSISVPGPQDSIYTQCKQDIYDCRNELSRLLGLIGAPPMGVHTLDDRHPEFRKEAFGNLPVALEISIVDTTTSVVSFLEAHVQVVLTIDKALYWVKVSSSLHWGLGPHSQCVERVERAAMSKEMLRAQPTPHTKKARMDQPQRRTDSSAVLALSSARRNIAHVITNEVNSISNTIKSLENNIAGQLGHTNVDQHHYYHQDEFLEMPDVIDIAWMKASRKYLANLLTYCADTFTTWDSLRMLSIPIVEEKKATKPLQVLKVSMGNAKNLREYLISHLLLDDDHSSRRLGSVRPISHGGGINEERKFILPLLHYQKQLEALDAALWSFQQYIYSQDIESLTICSSNDDTIQDLQGKHENHESEEEKGMAFISSEAKMKWWNQVKEISATCQALEADIGNKYFSLSLDDSSQNSEDEDDGFNDSAAKRGESSTMLEPQSYEHVEKPSGNEHSKITSLKSTKTLVFSGEGSKQKRIVKKKKQQTKGSDDSGTGKLHSDGLSSSAPPPVRDAFAEHLLLRELQNRVRSVAALREEEQVDPSPTEFEAISGEDEDQQPQNTMSHDESIVDCVDPFFPVNAASFGANDTISRKTAVTTNIFLGASGSLLEELKRNIISPDDIIATSDEIVEDNRDLVVATTVDTSIS